MVRNATAIAVAGIVLLTAIGAGAVATERDDAGGTPSAQVNGDVTTTAEATTTTPGTTAEDGTTTEEDARTGNDRTVSAPTDDENADAEAPHEEDGPTVTLSATGEVSAEPDRVRVTLAATASAESAGEATARLAENVSTLREALEDENLSITSVRTTGYQVTQARDDRAVPEPGGTDDGDVKGDGAVTYEARQSFEVTSSNTSEAGAIIDVAVDSGATEVYGVSFGLSDERRSEVRADAIDAAVENARTDAEAVASSAGLELDGVRSVRTGDGRVGPLAEQAADSGTVIDVSPVSVAATVEITYRATES